MRNIAIIGGYGFIGENFTEYFLKKGFSITVIGRNANKKIIDACVKSVVLDVNDTLSLVKAVEESEIVIWLASSLVPSSHVASLNVDFNTNIKPIIKFLETDIVRLNKFIYLSSGGTVYGDTTSYLPIHETHNKKPISEYGLSKLITESYIKFITLEANFESFILRPSNVYGKFQNLEKPQGIIGYAFKSLIDNEAINLYDDGKVIRDFVHVSDLANAVLKCIEKPIKSTKTNVYNVGCGKGFSIREILNNISKVAEQKVKTIPRSSRKFDCQYNVLSIEKIKSELHWEPTVELEEGLKEVWAWIKNKEND